VRFLIDECLRQQLAAALTDLGHDTIHVADAGLAGRPDNEIMDLARRDGRVVVSADTDFGELLATTHATTPSVVLFRGQPHDVDNLVQLIVGLLPEIEADLHAGAVVVIGRDRARVRRLPIGG
jgi:predicted nuclease of predicted toxin-antitoxin system